MSDIKLTGETIQIAANVGLQILDIFLFNRGETRSEDEIELRNQLAELRASISTAQGTKDFQTLISEIEKRKLASKTDDEEIEGHSV